MKLQIPVRNCSHHAVRKCIYKYKKVHRVSNILMATYFYTSQKCFYVACVHIENDNEIKYRIIRVL